MGRKRWWHGSVGLLLLCIVPNVVLATDFIGCSFSKNVCDHLKETCYNDQAFGRCVPLRIDINDDRLYQYNLDPEQLEVLRLTLEKLKIEGYNWPDYYTQCIVRTTLTDLRYGLRNDNENLCRGWKNQDDYQFREQNGLHELERTAPMAIVKFTPSNGNPHGEFADELYYPPSFPDEYMRFATPRVEDLLDVAGYAVDARKYDNRLYAGQPPEMRGYDDYDVLLDEEGYYQPRRKLRKKSLTIGELKEQIYQPRGHDHAKWSKFYPKSGIDSLKDYLEEDELSRKQELALQELERLPDARLEFLSEESKPIVGESSMALGKHSEEIYDDDEDVDDEVEHVDEEDEEVVNGYERTFSRKYKHPRRYSEPEFEDESWRVVVDYDLPDDDDAAAANVQEAAARPLPDEASPEDGIYTEGGLLESMKHAGRALNADPKDLDPSEDLEDAYNVLFPGKLEALLRSRELAGFKRRERLDVKKPGPSFATNNFAFKTRSPADEDIVDEEDGIEDIQVTPPVKKELNSIMQKSRTYKNVDMDHVYIEFKQEFHTWLEGKLLVEEVGKLLGLNSGALKDVRVGRAEVTFKVVENNKNLNATDVVNSIDEIRDKLRTFTGFEVIRAGIGDKAKLPATLEVVTKEAEMSSNLFGAMVAAGVAAATAAAVVTLVIARRHAKSRAKLAGLATPDPEASKDYQELCRARMQAKQPTEKPESPRITSLSRESESNNSPSNRSSTSSWGDEPTLTNMDISTGHMVLSYMEDHLKNKDRLEQEWAAICAYEADPSSIEIAQKESNAKYNRPGAALPYDHSRIVLNDLTNANNCDYINASTITDHDPRNPAYIATQGPTPQTAADFWQLVWEQGSVVIVMLTRLTEEGRAMCHCYWPDVGSELYHIYEVHLVSEHFWCDDYLVRSFYLKNLRTGETRTVTQFHFMSWPENGVPHSTKALLEFRRKVNKSYRGRSCPIVVHCSDGAGRTGTYCLIDMVLNRMAKGAKEIDIAATLEHIRDQRPHMVATKQQFEFVLMAVAEEVHAILKALPAPAVATEKSVASGNGASNGKTEQ